MKRHSPDVLELIECGKLFPASELLPPEKANAHSATAEVNNDEAPTV